jgi:hypothetical protein
LSPSCWQLPNYTTSVPEAPWASTRSSPVSAAPPSVLGPGSWDRLLRGAATTSPGCPHQALISNSVDLIQFPHPQDSDRNNAWLDDCVRPDLETEEVPVWSPAQGEYPMAPSIILAWSRARVRILALLLLLCGVGHRNKHRTYSGIGPKASMVSGCQASFCEPEVMLMRGVRAP